MLFPAARKVLPERQWELVRRVSPTRPHPTVSRRPPGQTLSALPLTVLDRGLAAASGAVERLPIMQRGERPGTRDPA